MALQLVKTTVDFLKSHPEEKFTARKIADQIFEDPRHKKDCMEKLAKSPVLNTEEELIKQMASEIAAHRKGYEKRHNIKTSQISGTFYYYYSEKDDDEEIEIAGETLTNTQNAERIVEGKVWTEEELYEKLSAFLKSEFSIWSKRIDEKSSSNSRGAKGNRWLHPDVVGIEVLNTDWQDEIQECVKQYGDKKSKLWSFEVKKLINSSNLREAFFQTVSNSSWANFSYLVAAEIQGSKTMQELRILCALHGVGYISLDRDNPTESQILIPAHERTDIDWNSANRLAEENKDFLKFIKQITNFYKTNDTNLLD